MLVSKNELQKINLAWLTEKAQAPFFCPECNKKVVLKKGKIRAHHFAHKPPTGCLYGAGESQRHYIIKRQIYETLKNHPCCSKCEIERRLNGVRPDISLYINKTPVAIEIQKAPICIDDILRRTKRYTELGVYLLWILADETLSLYFHAKEEVNVHRIKEWEKYLHALYWGRVYYWKKNALVLPCHLSVFETWIDESDWGDGSGGFYHRTKSLKTIKFNRELHIIDDFKPIIRKKWASKNWKIPNAKLWIDKTQKWW